MPYVYSTITNDMNYCEYAKGGNDLPQLIKSVLIKGGTGIATKHLVTPRGVVTNVSEDDLAFLKANEAFRRHEKRGFLIVDDKKVDPEVHAADMEQRDGSSPRTPEDYIKGEGANPSEDNRKENTSLRDRIFGQK